MNIIELLKEDKVITKIRYYGLDDLATGWGITRILENKEKILKYFKIKDGKIEDLDDYIDYLYLKCAVKYKEAETIVKVEFKEDFNECISVFEKVYEKYTIKELKNFILNNYTEILSNEYKDLYIKHDVIDFTIELLFKYNGNNETIVKYIIENYSYKVYDNFDSFKKSFKESPDLCYYRLLLSKDLIEKDSIYRIDKIAEVLKSLKSINFELYEEKVELFVKIIKEKNFDSNEEKVMNTYGTIKKVASILEALQHKSCFEFKEELKKQEETLDEYLKKHGQSTSFEISIEPVVKMYEDTSKQWYEKSLIITHGRDKSKKKLITNLEYTMKYYEKSELMDLVSTNYSTDDIFTFSVQNNISICMMQGKHSINYMISDDTRLNDLISFIFAGINNYFGEESLYYKESSHKMDLQMLKDAILEFKKVSKTKLEIRKKWILYSIENLLCGIIEKTLRNVYYEKSKNDKYTSSKFATLENLLKSQELRDEIGIYNCDCIEYYLLSRRGVGRNVRNDFAHYNDDVYDKMTYDTILEELYLLLVISNTLMLIKK